MASKLKWVGAEEEFKSWIDRQGKSAYAYQFFDTREAIGTTKSKILTQARPSDFLVTISGETFFAEVKSSQNETSFPLSNIRKQQWISAIQTVAAGGSYYFYIRHDSPDHIGVWYRIPAVFFIELQKQDIKSVKWIHLNIFKTEMK